jgi:hypothetical protein
MRAAALCATGAALRRGLAHALRCANRGHHHRVHFQYAPRRTHTASKYWRQTSGNGMQRDSPACRAQFHRSGTQLRARICAHAYGSSRAINARCGTLPKCLQCIRKARHPHWSASITHMMHHQPVRAKSRQGSRRHVERARNISGMQCPTTQRCRQRIAATESKYERRHIMKQRRPRNDGSNAYPFRSIARHTVNH